MLAMPLPLPWGSGEGIRKLARIDDEVGVVDDDEDDANAPAAAAADDGDAKWECSASSFACFDVVVDDDAGRAHCGCTTPALAYRASDCD